MLTDWERHQLAEIERGLNEDFARSRRVRRAIAAIKPGAVASVLLFVGCIAILAAVGAWMVAIALTAVYALVIIGGRRSRHRPYAQMRGGHPRR